MTTIGDMYQEKIKKVAKQYSKEFMEAFSELEEAAKRLNLSEEYKKIWEESTNPARDLRRFVWQHNLYEEYKKAMDKLTPEVKAALSSEYSSVWTPEKINELRDVSKSLKEAYRYLLRGDYDNAARVAGIERERIAGVPIKNAMAVISDALGIGRKYMDIIRPRSDGKFKARCWLEKEVLRAAGEMRPTRAPRPGRPRPY